MAAVQPLPNAAWVKVEVAFADNWNAASPTWTDVTSRIRFAGGGVQWSRGRNDEYQAITPGTCTITFSNRDRAFDPTYAAGPFYPYVDPARPVRITCYWPTTSTAYVQFLGQIEDWVPQWAPGGDSVCVATGVEVLGALAFYRIVAAPLISTTAQARLADLCNRAGIPAARQSFEAGSYALTSQTYTNTDILSACQQVVDGQKQVFYSTRDGIVSSHAAFTGVAPDLGTFGDGAGELKYAAVSPSTGTGYLYTQVQMSAAAPTGGQAPPTVSANVSTYPTRYGTRVLARNIAATTQALAQSAANSLASSLASQSLTRIKAMVLNPLADPTNLWPVVLAADFANPLTVKASPPGGGTRFSQAAKIRSIAHAISMSGWSVTWNLSP